MGYPARHRRPMDAGSLWRAPVGLRLMDVPFVDGLELLEVVFAALRSIQG